MSDMQRKMKRQFSGKLTFVQRSLSIERYQELKSPNHRAIFLIGVVGAEKSSFVNFLVGERVAEVGNGFYAVTTESRCWDIEIKGRWLRVVDIPGSFDPARNKVQDASDNG